MKPRFDIELKVGEYIMISTKEGGKQIFRYTVTVLENGQIKAERELRNYG